MLFGRPVNLWLGLSTAIVGAIEITAVALGADGSIVATVGGAWGAVIGAVILVVANQPPTLSPGDPYTISTPKGQPDYQATVAPPPAPTKPVPVDKP